MTCTKTTGCNRDYGHLGPCDVRSTVECLGVPPKASYDWAAFLTFISSCLDTAQRSVDRPAKEFLQAELDAARSKSQELSLQLGVASDTIKQLEKERDQLKQQIDQLKGGTATILPPGTLLCDNEAIETRVIHLSPEARAVMSSGTLKLVCKTCKDTHRMWLADRQVMCTYCPTPCIDCGSGGPYCTVTPCPCSCHLVS